LLLPQNPEIITPDCRTLAPVTATHPATDTAEMAEYDL
jgi:hypothetical protein